MMQVTEEMVARGYAERGTVQNFCPNDMRRMLDAALNPPPPTSPFIPGDYVMTPKWKQVHKEKAVPAIVIPHGKDQPLKPGSIHVWMPGLERAEVFDYAWATEQGLRFATEDEIEAFKKS